MSILIKGMKIPKAPGVYSLDLYVDEICQIQNLDGRTFEAIELPPHGRCIDADVLMSGVDDGDDVMFVWAITDAPTIIPAEEGE